MDGERAAAARLNAGVVKPARRRHSRTPLKRVCGPACRTKAPAAAGDVVETTPVSGAAAAESADRCGSRRRSAACFGRRHRRKRRPLRKPPQKRRLFRETPPPEAPAAAEAAAEAPPVSGGAAAGSAGRCGSRRRSAACFGRRRRRKRRPLRKPPSRRRLFSEAPPVFGCRNGRAPWSGRGFRGPCPWSWTARHGASVDSVDRACGVGSRVMERPWIPWSAPVALACAP